MFLDTSGLICHQYAGQPQHERALDLLERPGLKLTHSYVLAEYSALIIARKLNRLEAQQFLRALPEHPLIEVVWVDRALHEQGLALLDARPDKLYTLCDAVSFVLMRARRITEALTRDHHFEQEGFQRLLV